MRKADFALLSGTSFRPILKRMAGQTFIGVDLEFRRVADARISEARLLGVDEAY